MKVVFDTNVFVSALTFRGGRGEQALRRIIECAFAGGVDVIVTGDRSVLKLGDCRGVKIVSLREYLESR